MRRIEFTEDEWELIEARLQRMPPTIQIGILGKLLTKKDILKEVKKRTGIGETIAAMELEYLKHYGKRRSKRQTRT